ncbi:hypothetical protein ADK67_07400 [Saccharothrix sp. NRRL B-16348]|uniref:hypothetical protein n=1 Tax=Saccharothrix sp. NRRL B-16348 TaxID=1415542 RepID=UPI0006AE525B|nr:hypothetical protein [Saccharothrix sp. NRRL B-16348]KOX32503.1 hypothetical protein ADK67_07400 [Saccharothrix sp. NRRL B-16348]
MTHPALQKAMDGCARLAQAAATVGSPDPIAAIRQIDYDPEAIQAYVDRLRQAASDLDKAIEQQENAIAEHEAGAEGSASDSARAEMNEELAQLRDERKRLEDLIGEVERISTRMDGIANTTADQVLAIAAHADPAVAMVLDGSWLDDVTGDGAAAEETVHVAVADVIKACQAAQEQVAALRSELNANMDAAESGGGGEASSGGGAEAGTGEGGAAGSGQPEAGTSGGGGTGAAGSGNPVPD